MGSPARAVREVTKNPLIRPIVAAGTLGASELVHGAADVAAPEQKSEGLGSFDAPGLGDVEGGLASDAELQDKLRRRKGRASTILTGPQGISNVGDSNVRRRTLLAF